MGASASPSPDPARAAHRFGAATAIAVHLPAHDALDKALGAGAAAALRPLHDALTTTAARHRLEVAGAHPGALLVALAPDAPSAVAFALELQAELLEASWSDALLACADAAEVLDGDTAVLRGPRVTVGLATGWAATTRRDDALSARGQAVDVALALARAAGPGLVALDADTWQRGADAAVEAPSDCGDVRLAQVEGEHHVRLLWPPGCGARAQAGLTSLRGPTNLRTESTPFVGRAAQLQAILSAFKRGARVVNLCGPPGMGKSRLARRAAAALHAQFAPHGGTWWCDAREARSLERLLQLVAQSLGVPLTVAGIGAAHQLGQALAERGPTLLIVDGPERVSTHVRYAIDTWIADAPSLRVIVTSRHRAAGPDQVDVGALDPDDALELFCLTADPQGTHDLSGAELTTREAIVERVEHAPLAIEIAAAWTDLLSPDQLLWRLRGGLHALGTDPRGHHDTLDEVMELSWKLLEPWERDAFVQCSVFRGGFTLRAAEAVITLTQSTTPRVGDTIAALVAKSLMRTWIDRGTGVRRFALYDVTRAFAVQRLQLTGLRHTAESLHARWGIAHAAKLDQRIERGDGRALEELASEEDNLLAIAKRRAEVSPPDAVSALLALTPLLAIRGPFDALVARTQEAVRIASTGSPSLHARARLALARALLARGRAGEALEQLSVCDSLTVDYAPAGFATWVGTVRGEALHALGRLDEAQTTLSETLHEAGAHDNVAVRAHLGRVLVARGDLNEGRHHLTEAARLQTGRARATTLMWLANAERAAGEPAPARERYLEAHKVFTALGDRPREGQVLGHLGSLEIDLDDRNRAATHLAAALKVHKEVGDRRAAAIVTGDMGRLHHLHTDARRALQALHAARKVLAEVEDARFHALLLSAEGLLVHEAGRPDSAIPLHTEALDTLDPLGDTRFAALIRARLAAACADSGDLVQARAYLDHARARISELPDPIGAATVEIHAGHVRLAGRNRRGAEAAYRAAAGDVNRPGPARVSADARIAARILLRALKGWKK